MNDPKRRDLKLFQGDTPAKLFRAKVRATDGTMSDRNLTGSTLTLICKATVDTADAQALFTLVSPTTITITEPLLGKFTVNFQPTNLDNPGAFVYRVKMTLGAVSETIGFGTLEVVNT